MTRVSDRKLKIVLVHEVFVEKMGYANTAIPKILAKNGYDVHYVTAGLPPYYNLENQERTYGDFVEDTSDLEHETKDWEGVKIHYMPFRRTKMGIELLGLKEKLSQLQPDVVQTFHHLAVYSLQAAMLKPKLKFKLFTGNHTTASTYPLAQRESRWWELERIKEFLKRGIPGRFISSRIELCHGATKDCSDVAVRFFGVPKSKIKTIPLGVETDVFFPNGKNAKGDFERGTAENALRQSLDVADQEIMCVYTGRFSEEKNPLLLAKAVAALRAQGHAYRAVFFGEGVQREAIEQFDGATVHEFVPYTELGSLYRSADIGVWPTQESTSMIDAAACGTPTIVNDTIVAMERIEGNGITYRLNDQADLERALLSMADESLRQKLGSHGAEKMMNNYSWEALVAERVGDYRKALEA